MERKTDGARTTVAVGLADEGAYAHSIVEKQRGNWVIIGVQGVDEF